MARLDCVLAARGIAPSRSSAKEMILSGAVTVNGKVVKKPSAEVSESDAVESSVQQIYVGRGAFKLEKAAEEFDLSFKGKVCLDIGASTGGFTDFMLKNGAARVYAVDVGSDQLAESLRSDSRVVSMEKTDIRNITADDLGGCVDFICTDVSFISLKMILPKIYELLKDGETAAVLIKPQFEAGKSNIGKHGIVKDQKVHVNVLADTDRFSAELGLVPEGFCCSPIKGGSGNIEYLMKVRKNTGNRIVCDFKELVSDSFKKL